MRHLVMPQMGESIVEGTLTRWLKKVGDSVERDEPLFEISTDKVDTEIPSPAAGVLSEVMAEEGATVAVDSVVARIEEAGGNGAAPAEAKAPAGEKAPAKEKPAQPESKKPEPTQQQAEKKRLEVEDDDQAKTGAPDVSGPAGVVAEDEQRPAERGAQKTYRGPLSPLVRRMAREHDLDLNELEGTGAGGRITKQDVESYLEGRKAQPAAKAPAAASKAPEAPAAKAPVEAPSAPPRAEQPRTHVEQMSNMRAKIAEHMTLSKQTSAHVTTVHRVDMTKVAKVRNRHKEDFKTRYGTSLTFLSFVIRACSQAIREFPFVNASIDGRNIIYHNQINIGIAVALENGLIVPVIRDADEKNVVGLQRAVADLAARARSRQLKPDEVQGGTFSITNFGSFGSLFATPVINQPQVAIMGLGSVERMPVVINDAIGIRDMAYLSLTFDHRLIDGAPADQFVGRVKHILENWSEDIL